VQHTGRQGGEDLASTAGLLRQALDAVTDGLDSLIRTLPIKDNRWHEPGIVYVAPDYAWGDIAAGERAQQLSLKRSYDLVSERLRLLVAGAPEELTRQLADADVAFRVWVELDYSNWHLSPSSDSNVEALRADAAAISRILDIVERLGAGETFAIPDTNSLLRAPDPVAYRDVLGQNEFTFTLLPTVLGELDRLKIEHRNPDVRDKAKAVIGRIKGWRNQGTLSAGVKVDQSITVRALHAEPDMNDTLSWLDPAVDDDRIIAGVLAIQAEHPGARAVLITGDINLMNKSDAALVETAEAPQRARPADGAG